MSLSSSFSFERADLTNRANSIRAWRGDVGLLCATTHIAKEYDLVAPMGIQFWQALLGLKETTPENLKKMRQAVQLESEKLNCFKRMDVICLACTAGSFIGGPDYDKEIIEEIENASGSPGLTTSTALLELFCDMNIKKIALVAPYAKSVVDAEIDFMNGNGIEVIYTKALGFTKNYEYLRYYEDTYATFPLVVEASKAAPDADAIFVSCMISRILGTADVMEKTTGMPVISSLSATLYGILKKLGIQDPVSGYGQALRRQRKGIE